MFYRRVLNKILIALLLSLVTGWIVYIVWGHELIETIYKSHDNPFFSGIMAGRSVTRLEDYYYAADMKLINFTGRSLLIGFVLAALVNSPLGTLLSTISFLVTSFVIFALFEAFPFLIGTFHLDILPYFASKNTYLPDPSLVYVEKPNNYQITRYFRGHAYSPTYGIKVKPETMVWKTDGEGFRNDATPTSADIVVLGDSYIEYGLTETDTFGKRLEAKLTGLKVANLGKSGYNPFQYLEVFKRFGIRKQPKYALFCFYEGNDINEMKAYMAWQRGESDYNVSDILQANLFQGYVIGAREIVKLAREHSSTGMQYVAFLMLYSHIPVHPDITVIRLPTGHSHRILIIPRLSATPPEEMLRSDEWGALKRILIEFRRISDQHNIVPIIVYIPTANHIYAEYSTQDSGKYWLAELKEQIAAKTNTETAMSRLAHELSITVIDLSTPFEHAAKNGRLIYYPLDTHWNSEGREVAAQFVANRLVASKSSLTTKSLLNISQ